MKTFIFDFDSTIFPEETLDEIIQYCFKDDPHSEEKSKEITNICNLGMSGIISMEESLKRRLDIASPTKENIAQYVRDNKQRIDDIMKTVLRQIQEKGHQLFVVSGGFEEWIKPLLEGIVPEENIHANKIRNTNQPMSFDNIDRRDKEGIIKGLNIKGEVGIMVGDGATDYSVFKNRMVTQFIGTFFYVDKSQRQAVVDQIELANQVLFESKEEFSTYIAEII